MRQIRALLWQLVLPFLNNTSTDDLPFKLLAQWYRSDSDRELIEYIEIVNSDEQFVVDKRSLRFCVLWTDPS